MPVLWVIKLKKFLEKYEIKNLDILFIFAMVMISITLLSLAVTIGTQDIKLSGLLKGSDFDYFAKNSLRILNGQKDQIYSIEDHKAYQKDSEKKSGFRQINSPLLYYLYIPFAIMPRSMGILMSSLFFLLIYITAIIFMLLTFKRLFKYRFIILFFSLLFPPFIIIMLIGQPSVIYVFILALSFFLAKRNKAFMAGAVLSLFLFKPHFYILLFIILLFSFRPRLFFGLFSGTAFLLLISGSFDGFYLWKEWGDLIYSFRNEYLSIDAIVSSRELSKRGFFYLMHSGYRVSNILEYIWIMIGFGAILAPVIYSFFHKRNFSRNSFWFILPISIILASPFIYNFEVIMMMIPLVIFLNLMMADHVSFQNIILILVGFCLGFIIFAVLDIFTHIQLFAFVLWFFLINGTLARRVRHYTRKSYHGYWEDLE